MHAKIKVITAMLIFGSIGAFVRNIDLSPGSIAFLRAAIGTVFLMGSILFLKERPSYHLIRKNLLLLGLAGAALGINWVLLFQAYEHTSIANATLSYYFAPIFVIILAPPILKEQLTPIKVVCVFVAMLGLFFIVKGGNSGHDYFSNHVLGIIYGLLAAVFYASVTLTNKLIKGLSGFETTLVQLACVVLVLFPYLALNNELCFSGVGAKTLILVLAVGIIHTGLAFLLYFTAIKDLKGQTIAVLSYIDPIAAVIIAAIFLGESMNFMQVIGGVLILGAAFLSEKLEIGG
jgi:RarD protein